MSTTTFGSRTVQDELRTALATMHCLAEIALERRDDQSAQLLHNAACLLEIAITRRVERWEITDKQMG
jgi:hypothetical protein